MRPAARVLLLLGCLTAGLGLVACDGDTGPAVGRVIDRQYDDPDEWYVPGYVIPGSCSGGYQSGDTYIPRTCTADIWIPGHTDYDGPHWRVKLERGEAKTHEVGWRSVSESKYNECQLLTWCDTTQ